MTCGGLPDSLACSVRHRALALDNRLVQTVDIEALRIGESDMHGDLTAEGLDVLRVALRLERDDDADLAEARRDRVVHVAGDGAVLGGEIRRAAKRHVLADRADQLLDGVVNGSAATRKLGLGQLVEISLGLKRSLGDARRHLLEGRVAGDEIRLGIDLDQRRLFARRRQDRSNLPRRRGRPSWRPWRDPWS